MSFAYVAWADGHVLVLRSSWKVTLRYGSDIFFGRGCYLVGLGFGCALEIYVDKGMYGLRRYSFFFFLTFFWSSSRGV